MAFFKSLRKTLGVVTLVIACILSLWWARSLRRDEVLNLNSPQMNFAIRSYDGRIQFRRFGPNEASATLTWHSMRLPEEQWKLDDYVVDDWKRFDIVWRMDFLSVFHAGTGIHKKRKDVRLDLCVIPYWSIVIPLTVCSTYLLLARPRVKASVPPPAIQL